MSAAAADIDVKRLREALGARSIVLVGLMGAGKSSIGRRLAHRLGLPFVDADAEIEKAADLTIPEIFEKHGEAYFRAGEVRVVARILDAGPQVLATGGGAYMNPETRARIRERGVSLWLKADLDVLMKRVKRRGDRPLLKADDPKAVLRRLMDERYPVYAEAELTVVSREASHDDVVEDVLAALAGHLLQAAERGTP
ncbi:MAG: shikimate kinase [Xanthobacteraceae bacterium]|nr:MAG: shikimate kinase [Xanthobacteraceae bacterium]